MRRIFRTRHRVVRDGFLGFEAQFRYWWMPFYMQMWHTGMTNTHRTVEDAVRLINQGKRRGIVLTDEQIASGVEGTPASVPDKDQL